ncbi:DEAD/DEAH box helicase [Paraburkholderia sp. RL18-085-BIA-A]|uniref:DEAD/DEAH box helicase n=1 Tax=Paraburkholderia sp. RL18-085-BIA-A TaxID=3031633 RepID=UPI0038BD765A
MKPETNSRRLFGITRSKGKMYEFGLPESMHLALPERTDPNQLILLTVGTLGDVAAEVCESAAPVVDAQGSGFDDLDFSASYLDALLESKYSDSIRGDILLLASAAYYIARRPGSSLVLARSLDGELDDDPLSRMLRWVLQGPWDLYPTVEHRSLGSELNTIAMLLFLHFNEGSSRDELEHSLVKLRRQAYESATAHELLLVDLFAAVVRLRLAASVWTTLPSFTGLTTGQWIQILQRQSFPKELWPAQTLLGERGIFKGASGVVQMPTSAGKTRSVEIVLRSAFLSGRARIAVVVAPFKALCHEIGTTLRQAFKPDGIKVNELSDAIQLDFLDQIAELLGSGASEARFVLVLTPEKLLYVLRQTPKLVDDIGVVVYDEGHQFDSGSRGITYELLLTEIKKLISTNSQTLLISAVVNNAKAIGDWLIGEDSIVVSGQRLTPTTRSIAFASWVETMGQLLFYESPSYTQYDYFVPRVIEQSSLTVSKREKPRNFPEKGDSNDISLYLGIRLAPQGSVAVFCGKKATAAKFAERAAEVYRRGLALTPPAAYSDPEELSRLQNLVADHFGVASSLYTAAGLGVFVHHGNTPHGLRLAIEHAMQRGYIRFIACTSTLAQGVNLPIRYLIVAGVQQSTERVKVRDFQNLMGRAGRAGMHTEGLVIFADPQLYDKRNSFTEGWRFDHSKDLLTAEKSEDTTSSLLQILAPFKSRNGTHTYEISAADVCRLLLGDEANWEQAAAFLAALPGKNPFDHDMVLEDLRNRRKLLDAVESYLMANRGEDSYQEFLLRVEELAKSTLAFHLGDEVKKAGIVELFAQLSAYVNSLEPEPARQAAFAKTLLSARDARKIADWVSQHAEELYVLESSSDWLNAIWPLISELSDSLFFHTVAPSGLGHEIAAMWLDGKPYHSILKHVVDAKGTRPWGEKKRRRLSDDDVLDFLEKTLAFECSLLLSAVAQFLFGESTFQNPLAKPLNLFLKAFKYGLPDNLAIACYESGFPDRVIAQELRDTLVLNGYQLDYVGPAIKTQRESFEEVLQRYPSYFSTAFESLG